MAPNSDFSSSWLALREAADHRARDVEPLNAACRHWLTSHAPKGPLRLLDQGCGNGNNLRYLAPRLPPHQHWCLIDQDAVLLTHAGGEGHPRHEHVVALDCLQRDLSSLDQALTKEILADTTIVTASALLDLVSESWLDALIKQCDRHQCAVWLAMSINGDNTLIDHGDGDGNGDTGLLEMDQQVQRLIKAHQQRDKGFNGALGTHAPIVARALLEKAGYQVLTATSPWQLNCRHADEARLAESLMQGWLEAALEQAPDQRQKLLQWHEHRQQHIAQGRLDITVGHTDLLAVPAAFGLS